jgi:hypothetical protein
MYHDIYSNNYTTIKREQFKNVNIPPTCFGIQWPSSVQWLSKKRVVIASYIRDVQIKS